MCVAVPVQITEIIEEGIVQVDRGGVRTKVSSMLVDDLNPGDFVLVHAGFILQKLDPREAGERLKIFENAFKDVGIEPCSANEGGDDDR